MDVKLFKGEEQKHQIGDQIKDQCTISDTDSDGMDCLVANETLQFSEFDCKKRKSPEIRRITKRASFVSNVGLGLSKQGNKRSAFQSNSFATVTTSSNVKTCTI